MLLNVSFSLTLLPLLFLASRFIVLYLIKLVRSTCPRCRFLSKPLALSEVSSFLLYISSIEQRSQDLYRVFRTIRKQPKRSLEIFHRSRSGTPNDPSFIAG